METIKFPASAESTGIKTPQNREYRTERDRIREDFRAGTISTDDYSKQIASLMGKFH